MPLKLVGAPEGPDPQPRSPRTRRWIFRFGAALALLSILVIVFPNPLNAPRNPASWIVSVAILAGLIAFLIVCRRIDAARDQRAAEARAPKCRLCGQTSAGSATPLSALQRKRCPECGQEINDL